PAAPFRCSPRLATGRTSAAARQHPADPRRSRAHRVRLVGRRRCTPRLLRGADAQRPAWLGLPCGWRQWPPAAARLVRVIDYAELHCLSNFSFQRGASSAQELFERAARLGYRALAITDECTLAGVVRAWQASKDSGVPLIVGSEMPIEDGPRLV